MLSLRHLFSNTTTALSYGLKIAHRRKAIQSSHSEASWLNFDKRLGNMHSCFTNIVCHACKASVATSIHSFTCKGRKKIKILGESAFISIIIQIIHVFAQDANNDIQSLWECVTTPLTCSYFRTKPTNYRGTLCAVHIQVIPKYDKIPCTQTHSIMCSQFPLKIAVDSLCHTMTKDVAKVQVFG